MDIWRNAALVLLGGALALDGSACTNVSSCSRSPDSSTVALASASPNAADGGADPNATGAVLGTTYTSAPWGGPYAYFPAFRTITFQHGLQVVPQHIEFWLAFSSTGTLAPSAGNITELLSPQDGGAQAVTDETITVYNNTCSEFYLRVVASP